MIEFSYPWVFVLLLLAVLINKLPLYYISKRSALRISFKEDIDAVNGANNKLSGISRASLFQKIFSWIILLLVVAALAKPLYIGEPLHQEISQREVLISVDLSGSMATKDFKDQNGTDINRLDAVKMVLGDFFKQREGEKLGLILFGSAAFVQAPFTQDLNALEHLLSELNVGMAGPQTALGDSIGLAIKMFQDSNVTDRMLIVMSDGDDTGSKVPPLTAAKLAAKHDVSIFTIAMGDPKNAGEHPIDTETLKEIAKTTGGKFYYAWDAEELSDIYTQIDKLKPKDVKEISHRPKFDLFRYPLMLALFFLFMYGSFLFIQSRKEQV
ncbi:MAG: VWA domain-containing protein [Sulfurovum sp.]|nr:VWA domain-containing protein [Sulfurovum sp.]